MEELRIIWRKFPTFTFRNIIGIGAVLGPWLESHKDMTLDEITAMAWISIIVGCAVALANNSLSWLSTAASRAREEIAAESTK